MVHVIGPQDRKKLSEFKNRNIPVINTTSSAHGHWSQGLSPFLLGPVHLYKDYIAQRMENAWQHSKVYKQYTDDRGDPTPAYFEWAKTGWANDRACRYPMGKGARPEYSWWDGKKLGYIPARKKIYAPLYMACVVPSVAFRKLKILRDEHEDIALWDFDGYDYITMNKSLDEVLNDPKRTMGHAFILAMLLTLNKNQILVMLK